MDPVSNVDRLVVILRQRLESRAKGAAAGRSAGAANGPTAKTSNLRALAALEGVDDQVLGRTLIESILTEAFGADLLNDAKFQQVVDRVSQAIAQEDEGRVLLLGVSEAVRQSGRSIG